MTRPKKFAKKSTKHPASRKATAVKMALVNVDNSSLTISQDKDAWEIQIVTPLSATVIICPRRGTTADVAKLPIKEVVVLKSRQVGYTMMEPGTSFPIPDVRPVDAPAGVAAPDPKTAEMAMGDDTEWS